MIKVDIHIIQQSLCEMQYKGDIHISQFRDASMFEQSTHYMIKVDVHIIQQSLREMQYKGDIHISQFRDASMFEQSNALYDTGRRSHHSAKPVWNAV